MMKILLLCIAIIQMLGACAIGNQYDYRSSQLTIKAKTEKSVSAAVIDRRPYVLSGNKSSNFVGLQRGGVGNPFDVTTKSAASLSEDFTKVLQRSFQSQGISTKPLILAPGISEGEVLEQFQKQATDRLLLINMFEWKTDAMFRLTLHWNLGAAVFDQAGKELGRHYIEGIAPVPVEGLAGLESSNSTASSEQASRKLSELLNNSKIVSALQ